ncbi:hypothetical protein GALL_145970 [mine drainage metagenome]|uniref:Type IV pilus assembly protein PilW n=1 Tax=mine drainage metagenome TaxID=410659 RepID=A0A1J5SGN8_9ZZZZ
MNTITIRKRAYVSPCRQGGLSLVELMISLTIGLILLAGITALIVQQSSTRGELEKASREIENGRYAMQLLHDDIQLAGFYSEYSPASGVVYTVPADPCNVNPGSSNSGWDSTMPSIPAPIYGYPGGTADPTAGTTCGLKNYKPNTAILVVRRTATAPVAATAAVAGTTYLQVSQCNTSSTPFVLATSGFTLQQKDCATPADLRQYIVDIYYISQCDVCGANTDSIPTLKMVQSGTATPIPLVEGIDNMQFDYGVDNTGDGAPDSYTATPTMANWPNIMAVRVNLLARNNDITTGYADNKSYQLGSVTIVATGDPYKRHAYSELVRVINPSGRRE